MEKLYEQQQEAKKDELIHRLKLEQDEESEKLRKVNSATSVVVRNCIRNDILTFACLERTLLISSNITLEH